MKAIKFNEVNVELGKDQPQYNTLPVHFANNREGTVVACFELDEEELKKIQQTKKIWVQQLTFRAPLQPFSLIVVDDYFKSVVTDGTNFHVANEEQVDQQVKDLLKDKDADNEHS